MPHNDICPKCENPARNLHSFNEFSHLRPCAIKDIDGKVRESVEPVFKNETDLCYSCYKNAAKKYVAETQLIK